MYSYWSKKNKKQLSKTEKFMKYPSFGIVPPGIVHGKPNKELSYLKARKKYRLAPFADYDKDGRVNAFDCRPFDSKKHAVSERLKNIPVFSTTEPGLTIGKVFEQAEEYFPEFSRGHRKEEHESQRLESALMRRRELVHEKLPVDKVLGYHKLKPPTGREETVLAHDYIINWLKGRNPVYEYELSPKSPTTITIIEPPETKPEVKEILESRIEKYRKQIEHEKRKEKPSKKEIGIRMGKVKKAESWLLGQKRERPISSALEGKLTEREKDIMGFRVGSAEVPFKAPERISGLTKHIEPHKEMQVYLSDSPIDIMRKSSTRPWADISCERLGGGYDEGIYSDIALRSVVGYIYPKGKKHGVHDPSGRVMLRWGKTEEGLFGMGVEDVTYGQPESMNRPIAYDIQERVLKPRGLTFPQIKSGDYGGYSDVKRDDGVITYEKRKKPHTMDIESAKTRFEEKSKIPLPFAMNLALGTPEEKKVALRSPDLPHSYVKSLAQPTEKVFVRQKVAQREGLEPDIRELLSKDLNVHVLTDLLDKQKNLPEDMIVRLSKNPKLIEYIVQGGYFNNKNQLDIVKEVAKNGSIEQKLFLSYNLRDIPEEVSLILAKQHIKEVDLQLAQKALSPVMLSELLKSKDPEILSLLIENHGSSLKDKDLEKIFPLLKKDRETLRMLATSFISNSLAKKIAKVGGKSIVYKLLLTARVDWEKGTIEDLLSNLNDYELYTMVHDNVISRGNFEPNIRNEILLETLSRRMSRETKLSFLEMITSDRKRKLNKDIAGKIIKYVTSGQVSERKIGIARNLAKNQSIDTWGKVNKSKLTTFGAENDDVVLENLRSNIYFDIEIV